MQEPQKQERNALKAYGIMKHFNYDDCQKEIPLFWKDTEEYRKRIGLTGAFGICIMKEDGMDYIIADPCKGNEPVPEDCVFWYCEASSWYIFHREGECTEAIQSMEQEVSQEWMKDHQKDTGSVWIEVYASMPDIQLWVKAA